MKRVVAIAVIMVVVTTLFAFPGYATTYNPTTYNSYTDAVTYNGVTYNVRVTQLKALSEGTSLLPGGMETIMLVSLQMTNNTNNVKAATIPKLSIDLSDERVITDVFTYGGDFTLGLITGGIGIFYPGSEFSLDNNKVVVPPNKSLYCVGAIGLPAQLNQTGDGTLDTGLRGVHLYDKSNYSVTDGDYSYGEPLDISPVISYLEDIIDNQDTINDNLDDILTAIETISAEITYSGASYNPNNTSSAYVQNLDETYPLDDVTMYVSRYIGPSYYLSNDIELEPGNDVIVHTGTRVIPVIYRIVYSNESSHYLRLRYTNSINEFFPSGSYSYEINTIQNNMLYGFLSNGLPTSATNRRCHYYLRDTVGNYGYIAPKTRDVTIIYMNIYVNDTGSVTWGNPTLRFTAAPTLVDDVYHPNSVYQILLDLYKSLTKKEADDNTEEAQDMNDEIHEQEQVWYDQNSDALEEVGLSNYRFSQSQSSGITQAVTQFQAVWNALGSWTNVYIFILILSISTYIIRHEPTTRVKQYRSSVQAERAERISYYGRKNAEARASSSNSTFKAALRRRK